MRIHRYAGLALPIGSLVVLAVAACGPQAGGEPSATTVADLGEPSPDEVSLDPTTVPKFGTQLNIPEVWTATPVMSGGKVVQNNYTLSVVQSAEQVLPAGFPATTVLGYQGSAHPKGSTTSSTITVTPGATFENTIGIPSSVHWVDNIQQPAFLEVDPTFHWANPQSIEEPVPPFNLFPPGYTKSLFPVAHVTHTHGLMVPADQDGTAEEWFTPNLQYVGPSWRTSTYLQPNVQSPTALFYHDHVMGVTRIGLYSGVVGTADFLRDPTGTPLDAPTSPLPTGAFEVPLAISARQFYTDGNFDFPPDRGTLNSADEMDENGGDSPPTSPYWSYNEGSDEILVNGSTWPNLNVQRHQYRFRLLAAANAQLYDLQFCVGDWNANNNLVTLVTNPDGTQDSAVCNGTIVPFTIIGSDGGYLPAPQVTTDVQLGITERADILVDFSKFAAGTKITLINKVAHASNPQGTTELVMQFTVENTAAVTPPTLSASLFPARPTLTPNAPTRTKVLRAFEDDDPLATTFNKRSIDGLDFDTPPTEFALVGSTEEWDLLNVFPAPLFADDTDLNTHQIHIHLLEFQLLNRQLFDSAAYEEQWALMNGHNPITSQIVVSPTSFLQGPVIPPAPYETGWKDTIQAPSGQVTRILVRWAPQSTPAGGVTPGTNQFPIDPTSFPDPIAGPGYVWHCHLVGHEDHDMMRQLVVVNAWAPGVAYKFGTVVAFNNVDYRVEVAHTSVAGQTPDTRFDLWDRANTDTSSGGQWEPQIRYAVNDRVLFNGLLYSALSVFQSQVGQTPPANPALWKALPNDACGQLRQFCQGNSLPVAQACLALGQAGNEAACLGNGGDGKQEGGATGLSQCLSDCLATVLPTPCSGLCNNPVKFTVADGSNFQSGNIGTGAGCFETTSRIAGGESSSFVSPRTLSVNGRVEPTNGNWTSPLPPMRHDGYCIQTTAGTQAFAAFSAF
jgi:spore coat protein A